MNELAKRHEENSNSIKEIRASTDTTIRNPGASIKTLKIQIGRMSKVLQKRGFGSLPSSTETIPRDHVKSISTTVEADMTPIRHIGSSQYAVSAQQNSKLMFESRQATIPFSSRLNDYYFGEKKGSYGPQCLDSYSYGATRIDDSLPRKEKDQGSFTLPCYINNVCFENALADLGASVSVMSLSTYLNLGLGELAQTKLTVELADRTVKHPKGIAENILVGISKFVFPVDFIILDMPEDVKVPLILGIPFLYTAHAKIDVFKRKITLRVGEEKIIFKSVKPASSLIKRVYMLSLRERMELDLEVRLMGETLVLNILLNPLYGDYIELNDLNVPLELRRDQVDDLMPTIEEGKVVDKHMIEKVKTRDDNKMVSKIFGYPNDYDEDEKIHIDCAYNLKFSCMIGFEFVHANFFPNLPINVMSKKFYNSIMKDKIEFRGRNELGNFANVPLFIGNFYVITDFTVVEDMDHYLDEGMGEVVVVEPFCKVSCVETRRFDGIITIHDEDDNVTYQMVRSNPRFKHHTNEQCNKIPPLLKVSEQDKMNGISHPYQKLKSFYKGVLNLEPDFI
ncbi:putative reverse transcriptase domain-containing protein [Tanacetum coccineum]